MIPQLARLGQGLRTFGKELAGTSLGKAALADGGKELLKSSVPGAVITAGLSTLTTGNPAAGLRSVRLTLVRASVYLERYKERAKSCVPCQVNILPCKTRFKPPKAHHGSR